MLLHACCTLTPCIVNSVVVFISHSLELLSEGAHIEWGGRRLPHHRPDMLCTQGCRSLERQHRPLSNRSAIQEPNSFCCTAISSCAKHCSKTLATGHAPWSVQHLDVTPLFCCWSMFYICSHQCMGELHGKQLSMKICDNCKQVSPCPRLGQHWPRGLLPL